MDRQIYADFATPQEADMAGKFLGECGVEDVLVSENTITVLANDENWISACEILSGLGGEIANDEEFRSALENAYQISQDEETGDGPVAGEIPLIDRDSYIDPNLGYGDFEMLEPYVMENYEKMVEEQEG